MNCPYCNEEMEHGVLESARDIYYTDEPYVKWETGCSYNSIRLAKGIFHMPRCDAYRCKTCKKIILSYTETD